MDLQKEKIKMIKNLRFFTLCFLIATVCFSIALGCGTPQTQAGDGKCILVHNGTKMIKGTQDDAQGFCRVMHLTKDIVYWSVAQKDTYFICEDFTNKIPKYGKLI